MRTAATRRRFTAVLVSAALVLLGATQTASAATLKVKVPGGTAEISATSRTLASLLTPPLSGEPGLVPEGLVTQTDWVQQTATDPDTTTNPKLHKVTPRTDFMVQSALGAGITRKGKITCYGFRAQNPSSDHPSGRGCDLFYDHSTDRGRWDGWVAANWLVKNQAVLGVKYVIWQGQIWTARSRPGPWGTYFSTAYGCPNPENITGCHYDHIHVSMY